MKFVTNIDKIDYSELDTIGTYSNSYLEPIE